MGNATCCAAKVSELDRKATVQGEELLKSEAVLVSDAAFGLAKAVVADTRPAAGEVVGVAEQGSYIAVLDKAKGGKLGLDVDYMAERLVLPIMAVTGGLAGDWNTSNPGTALKKGDSIVEVNGVRGNVAVMLEKCKSDVVLNLVLSRAMTYDHLVSDLENLVNVKHCGPILIRLSWHDVGVFMQGKGGCPNAAMRFTDKGEGAWEANAGLPTVALSLLAPITQKYCPDLISHADLWALAANVSIRVMGGPDVPTRFGRADATSSADGVVANDGRLPDGDKGSDHLRAIFKPKGFDDRDIVALSGAHTVGKCHLERSGFDGPWTENPLQFDNTYYTEMMAKTFTAETTSKGCPQHRHTASGTMMLVSDLALLEDDAFKPYVQEFANDQSAFFSAYTKAWIKLQENGCESILRDVL
mmetsp:Transcript_49355/g.159329  ORF Transcript_49355/g.159329 Transcript_49355/m.159329 type:complete len:414 (+) Transcript_49355:74-1315(+)